MILHHKQLNIENLITQFKLNEQIIEGVTEFNFLGLTIDQHLIWNEHVRYTENMKQDIKITRDYVQIKTLFYPNRY